MGVAMACRAALTRSRLVRLTPGGKPPRARVASRVAPAGPSVPAYQLSATTCTVCSGRAAAIAVTSSPAMTCLVGPSLCHSRAAIGRQTGRSSHGNVSTSPAMTQQLPQAIRLFLGPLAAPSWHQAAAWTRRPERRNRLSSTASSTGAPGGTSRPAISPASLNPT